MKIYALLALAACGDNRAPAADATATIECAAAFTGNYTESQHGSADCAALTDGNLVAHVPVMTLSQMLEVSIAIGDSPSVGRLSSETISTWSANVDAHCTYRAGNTVVPTGNFVLTLDSVDPLHGTLAVTQYLLMYPGIPYCGDGDTELVTLTF